MADKRGISGRALARVGNSLGAPTFLLKQTTDSETSSYDLTGPLPFGVEVIDVWAVATADGATGDTVDVQDGAGNSIIGGTLDMFNSDAVDDTDIVRAPELDDAYNVVSKGDSINVVTASDAVAIVYVLCARAT